MQVIHRPENGSNFIEYAVEGNVISFGDEELMINLKKRERDDDVTLDICEDYMGGLVLTPAGARVYVAEIFIPARQYTEEETVNEGESVTNRVPVPFSMDNVVLTLYEQEV